MVHRGYEGIASDLQGQLDSFAGKLRKMNSPRAKNRNRGGLKGETIPEGYRRGRIKQFTSDQMGLHEQLMGDVGEDSYLNRLARGDEDLFAEMERPALHQFNALQGNLASRFSGMGQGARNSSGFQNAANEQSSDFAQQLQGNRQNLQRQAILDLHGLSRELLGQKPYENFLTKKQYPQQQQNQSGDLMGGLFSGIAGAGAGFASGGIPGAIAGGGSGFYKGYSGGY